MNLHVEPKLLGADAQERAGDKRVGVRVARHFHRRGRVEFRRFLPPQPLNRGQNALCRKHVQSLDLGQIGGEHFRQAAVEPVERWILREIGEVKNRQSLMAFRCLQVLTCGGA